ncbi:Anti-sigma F factor antagonist (spoIIAA-2); Anti-sigma B factor antagonist RsbV [hydrothermal vent metagenome]|uniref:Anti-sigma F factor antagonist (SpoIIAA-2) Anti-sigma B factor antagonist RsbV n=1 Tax=hydrothermal vent metagenome TaxID=652676 RepID=A0A3B0ZCW5_9ZZZZ
MAITVSKSDDGNTVTVKLPNEFDFRAHKEFRDTHKNPGTKAKYILDFSLTEHMDSSALGMLLLMREELGNDNAKVRLINCRDNIKSLLEMASFHQLFDVA